jgi:hypothetical protein
VTVKQLFETYVYAEILSSIDLLPFVITPKRWAQQTAMAQASHGRSKKD